MKDFFVLLEKRSILKSSYKTEDCISLLNYKLNRNKCNLGNNLTWKLFFFLFFPLNVKLVEILIFRILIFNMHVH